MRTFLRKALLKWRGSKRYDYLREYEQLQWQPLEVIEQYQFDRIKKLLNHAYDTVPYYRQAFEGLGIHPEDIKSRSDVARLPVLTKDIIRSNKGELTSSFFKPEQLKVFDQLPADEKNTTAPDWFVAQSADASLEILRKKCFNGWPAQPGPLAMKALPVKNAGPITEHVWTYTSQNPIQLKYNP